MYTVQDKHESDHACYMCELLSDVLVYCSCLYKYFFSLCIADKVSYYILNCHNNLFSHLLRLLILLLS